MNLVQKIFDFFERFFIPHIDPETPVEEWRARLIMIDGIIFATKTLIGKSTWGESKYRHFKLLKNAPKNFFGPQEPMFVVEGTFYGNKSKVLLLTKALFEEACGPFPIRSIEEEITWMEDVIVVLRHSVLEGKIRLAEANLRSAAIKLKIAQISTIIDALNQKPKG